MSGVAVIRHLLASSAAVTAQVPASRIMPGPLPLNSALPAIAISQVSSTTPAYIRTNIPVRAHTERVQVTVLASSYPVLKGIMKMLIAACPSQYGVVNTFAVTSIVPSVEGPDLFYSQEKIHAASRDFIVQYHA